MSHFQRVVPHFLWLVMGFLELVASNSTAIGQTTDYPWLDRDGKPVYIAPKTTEYDASSTRRHVREAKSFSNWNLTPRAWLPGSFSYWFSGVFLLILLLIVAVVIYLIAKKTSVDSVNTAETWNEQTNRERIRALPFQLENTTGDCRSLAERAFHSGDYRKAMICLFSHALIFLDQKQVVTLRRGKTNRQYLKEAQRIRPAEEYLSALIEPFEAVFFGDKEISAGKFESFWNALPQFERGVLEAVRQGAST